MSDKHLKEFWFMVGQYYGKDLSDLQIKMYSEDVADVPPHDLQRAFETHRKSGDGFFPLPGKLRKLSGIDPEPKDEANEVFAKIKEAVLVFGYTQPNEARRFMGELAWECVTGFGGWETFCCSPNLGNEGMIKAQLRDLAVSKINRKKQGRENVLPGAGLYDTPKSLPESPQESLAADSTNERASSLIGGLANSKALVSGQNNGNSPQPKKTE